MLHTFSNYINCDRDPETALTKDTMAVQRQTTVGLTVFKISRYCCLPLHDSRPITVSTIR